MKLSHVLLFSASLLSFQSHAMEQNDIHKNLVVHQLLKQEYTPGNCEVQETDKSICILPYKPRTASFSFNLSYKGIPQEFPHENRLARFSHAQDGRTQIIDTTLWSYVLHAQLSLHFSNGEYGGSGMLVGPHHILTTARNVYNPQTNEWVEKIVARIALNDTQAPFGEIKVANIYTFKEWIEDESPEFDMAFVTLDDSIGHRIGWAGLLAEEDAVLMQKDIHVTGYPGDKGFNQLWTMVHHIKKLKEERIFFKSASYDGQGGGSSWINQYGVPYVVGIHTLGGGNLYGNHSGVRLSRNKLKVLKKWIDATWEINPSTAFSFGSTTKTPPLPHKNSFAFGPSAINPISTGFTFGSAITTAPPREGPRSQVKTGSLKTPPASKQPSLEFSWVTPSKLATGFSFENTVAPVLSSSSVVEPLAFDEWRKGLLNIEKPWAKLLWEKCNDQNLTTLQLGYSRFSFSKPVSFSFSMPEEQNNKLTAEGVLFLTTGNFPNLISLDLNDNDIGDEGIKALANANLLSLTSLSLNGNMIGAEGIKFLVNGNFTRLSMLHLNNNKIDNEGAKFLANNNFTQLSLLCLNNNKINMEGIRLLAAGNFSNLSSLDLGHNNIGDAEVKVLSNGIFPSLTAVYLHDNMIGAEGAKFLAGGNLTKLNSLFLNNNKVNFEGITFLLNGKLLQLKALCLDQNNLLDEGAKAFENSKLTPSLTFLSLNNNKIGLEGVRSLVISNFSHLTTLCLNENNMMDEGAKIFSQGNFPRLESLEVMNNNLGDEGAKFLANGNLLSLRQLKLFESSAFRFESSVFSFRPPSNSQPNKITDEMKITLAKRFKL